METDVSSEELWDRIQELQDLNNELTAAKNDLAIKNAELKIENKINLFHVDFLLTAIDNLGHDELSKAFEDRWDSGEVDYDGTDYDPVDCFEE
jgi:hypothetical protein